MVKEGGGGVGWGSTGSTGKPEQAMSRRAAKSKA
jgi:hypothetical protein